MDRIKRLGRILDVVLLLSILLSIYVSSRDNYLTKVINASGKQGILVGKVIYVDPGHGGWDNGAQGDGVLEDELNLIIATKIYEKMLTYGAIGYISRIGDYDLASMYAKNRKDQDMQRRVNYINSISPDIFISIHLNYYSNPNVNGAQVFYKKGNEKAGLLAVSIQGSLNTLNRKNKEAKIGDYYLTNNSIYAGVIVECGFLSNYEDRKKLLTEDYQDILVEKISEGIVNYFTNMI